MKAYIPILLFLFVCLACGTEKNADDKADTEISFDQTKWKTKQGKDYPYRALMLNAVIYNDTIRTLRKDELIALLGVPDKINEGHLYYTISQTRLVLWPLFTKTMVVKLKADESIEWIKIHG